MGIYSVFCIVLLKYTVTVWYVVAMKRWQVTTDIWMNEIVYKVYFIHFVSGSSAASIRGLQESTANSAGGRTAAFTLRHCTTEMSGSPT
jgi:hypothetical protein